MFNILGIPNFETTGLIRKTFILTVCCLVYKVGIICQLDFNKNKVIIIIHNGIQKEGKREGEREERR